MNRHTVKAARKAAKEFVAAADALPAADKEARAKFAAASDVERWRVRNPLDGSRQSGATRRASLDLTRALAAMRKPG